MATEQSMLAVIRAARPSFRNRYDKAAFALHAAFLSAGFVLNATGAAASGDDALASSSSDEVGLDNWNEVEDCYAFVYSSPQKRSKKVLVKCLVMNDKLFVDALEEGDKSQPMHLEINVAEYVGDNGGGNYSSQFKNLGKLAGDINKELLGKLDGISSAGSSSQPSSSEANLRDDRGNRPVADVNTEDPYVSPLLSRMVPPVYDPRHSDLLPGPGAGMYPTRGDLGGGSSLIGPHDPMFGIGGGRQPVFPGGQPGVPPGARFDPFGPPGVPGFEPGRFARNPQRPGGGTHPDLHHFHDGADFI
ncbi:probable proteasome inhibitor [Andrographis paniculata]|uniref:probable proteasome inhibitor n=1 Tax=Andrographis paniculata TaxID=175694 RepID=UPI0021E73A5A|nr:probable proteasome inhibitor [Andrographis paniculata]